MEMSQVKLESFQTEGQEHSIKQNCTTLRRHHLNMCLPKTSSGSCKLINCMKRFISFQVSQV
jgi:hypothetical protein